VRFLGYRVNICDTALFADIVHKHYVIKMRAPCHLERSRHIRGNYIISVRDAIAHQANIKNQRCVLLAVNRSHGDFGAYGL